MKSEEQENTDRNEKSSRPRETKEIRKNHLNSVEKECPVKWEKKQEYDILKSKMRKCSRNEELSDTRDRSSKIKTEIDNLFSNMDRALYFSKK